MAEEAGGWLQQWSLQGGRLSLLASSSPAGRAVDWGHSLKDGALMSPSRAYWQGLAKGFSRGCAPEP